MEAGTEVRAVDGGMAARFGVVEVFAFGAVKFHRREVCGVVLAHGKKVGAVAGDARAFAEVSGLVFLALRH